MAWGQVITFLSIIGFLVTAAGLIGVSFKVGRNAQVVTNYRDSANAWETKARAQSSEIAELQEKLATNDSLIKKLQDRMKMLEELVTGQAAISSLTTSIDASFTNLTTHLDSLVNQIRDDIRGHPHG